jgi:hypothetical protein
MVREHLPRDRAESTQIPVEDAARRHRHDLQPLVFPDISACQPIIHSALRLWAGEPAAFSLRSANP